MGYPEQPKPPTTSERVAELKQLQEKVREKQTTMLKCGVGSPWFYKCMREHEAAVIELGIMAGALDFDKLIVREE